MDLKKYANEYTTISTEELKQIRDTWCGNVIESEFQSTVENLHEQRVHIKKKGTPSIRTSPLIQMLSVSVQTKAETLSIYGTIQAEKCDSGAMIVHKLYNRDKDAAETLVGSNKSLTLTSPNFSTWAMHEFTTLSRLEVILFDGDDDNLFAKNSFYLDDEEETVEDDYDRVKCKVIGSLIFRYIVIPFGISCRMQVYFLDRRGYQEHGFVNVNGKISVRYGNCVGDECVIFEKRDDEFERVEIHDDKYLLLSRCWVAVPAHSHIVVNVDLSEFETGSKIVNQTVELVRLLGPGTHEKLVQDNIITTLCASWFSSQSFGRRIPYPNRTEISTENMDTKVGNLIEDVDEMEADRGNESSDDESDDESDDSSTSSNLKLPWSLRPHKGGLWPNPAVEIFSVFIGRENSKAMQIYGSIEVLADDLDLCSLFKRDEKDALVLKEHKKVLPIPDGSRLFEHFISLGMKFDIKDVKGCSAIKGYVEFDAEYLDTNIWHERQLCSLIQGQNGFAVVHYSIFSDAVGARLKVYCQLKAGCTNEYPKIYGSLATQYSRYDYSTRYNKDYYRIVLLERTQDDPVEPSIDSTIPISRSLIVVPSYSSLIVIADLSIEVSGKVLACAGRAEIKICEASKVVETDDFFLRFEVDWCMIK